MFGREPGARAEPFLARQATRKAIGLLSIQASYSHFSDEPELPLGLRYPRPSVETSRLLAGPQGYCGFFYFEFGDFPTLNTFDIEAVTFGARLIWYVLSSLSHI